MFLYFDRLTRFKYPEDKYIRVFSDIILKNLINPSISKKQLLSLEITKIIEYVQVVWNYSLEINFKNIQVDSSVNVQIINLEKNYFNLNKQSLELINSNLNFLPLIFELEQNYKNLPINLKRICDIYYKRSTYLPIKKIILVEGITEDILLPKFALLNNCDFDKEGFYIFVSGGKNKIVKQYTNWRKSLKLPVFILLDKDGIDVFPILQNMLEKKDEIYMLKSGEFEDLLDTKFVLKTIKSTYPEIIEHISQKDFNPDFTMVKNLENYFKINGLGEFKKAEFANAVKNNCKSVTCITPEIKIILDKILLNT